MSDQGRVLVPVWVPAEELWSSVMGSAWESFPWWHEIEYVSGSWEEPGIVRVTGEDPDGDGREEIVGDVVLPDVVAAYSSLVLGGANLSYDDLDACDGDCVIQTIVYGKAVFG